MSVMVTGGAGYIGSHAVQRLLRDGQSVVAVDNLYRGHRAALDLLAADAGDRLSFVEADIGDRPVIEGLLRDHSVSTVMHFAALAYVGESVHQPLHYYHNNSAGALALLQACAATGVERFVFSSTCATYGEPADEFIPIPETCPQAPINPYGRSKLHVEHMLSDFADCCEHEGRPFSFAALRYFNVAGCDRSGILGEHHEPETHLIPVALQSVLGQRGPLTVFGTDYPTPDGTCIRDYVHVEDLVDAHVTVMAALKPGTRQKFNLGIGNGLSVLEVLESVKRVTGKDLAIEHGARRAGDPPMLYADPARIRSELGWTASITGVDEIIDSAWRWFRDHPRGYA